MTDIKKQIAEENERLRQIAADWLAPCERLGVQPSVEQLTVLLISVHAQAQLIALKRIQNDLLDFNGRTDRRKSIIAAP